MRTERRVEAAMRWTPRGLRFGASVASMVLALAVGACADESGGDSAGAVPPLGGGAVAVVTPGATDFAAFKALVDSGAIPDPKVLDDLGFFAEHSFNLPPPTCGEELCMHAALGVRGNLLTGTPCTILQIGLNSSLDPSKLARPNLHLVAVVDVSSSMSGKPIADLREGLLRLLGHMQSQASQDLLSIVAYSDQASVVVEAAGVAEANAIQAAIQGLDADGATNLYAGLAVGSELIQHKTPKGFAGRVVLLSDGLPTAGLVDGAKTRALARKWAHAGVGLTTVGVGAQFDHELLTQLAEIGQGNAYFLSDSEAVREVFVEESNTALFPVAAAITIRFDAADGWVARGAYGARDASLDDGGATLRIPALSLAKRLTAVAPITGSRRGGGGAIQIELMPLASNLDAPQLTQIGSLSMEWRPVAGPSLKTQSLTLTAPQLSSATAAAGLFDNPAAEKGFVMLNLFVGLRLACALVRDGDVGAARGTLEQLHDAVAAWLKAHDDADIADDLTWVGKLRAVLKGLPSALQTPIVPPPEPWFVD